MKVPPKAWIVVADGEKHLILQNQGDPEFLDLRVRSVDEASAPQGGNASDQPGRYRAPGDRRTSLATLDPKARDEIAYSTELAQQLNAAVSESEVRDLIVMADARTMGVLRQHFSANVVGLIQAEIVGDFTHSTIEKIEEVVRNAA